MGGNETLTIKQHRFVVALCEAPTISEAALRAGIATATAWRYLADPAVKAELHRRYDAALTQATTGMVCDMATARRVMSEIMADASKPPGVRVRAALGTLDAGLRLLEVLSLAERVAELERQMVHEH